MYLVIRSLVSILVFTVAFMSTNVVSTRLSYDVPRSTVYQVVSNMGIQGSGVLIAPGLMITAGHVVASPGAKFTVKGKEAKVLRVDEKTDLALLSVDLPCPCAPLAAGSPYQDTDILAIGYPLGLPQLATEGTWQTLQKDGMAVSDVSTAFGNSGGGLFYFNWFKGQWELVGVTTAIAGADIGFIGIPVFTISLSVPIEKVLYFIHHG